MKTINMQPGIGDNLWILMKLLSTGEKFDFKISENKPQRGKQIFDMLPQVTNSCTYAPHLPYEKVERCNAQRFYKSWDEIQPRDGENEYYLSMNKHLEEGHRIEEWFPDLETNFHPSYELGEHTKTSKMIEASFWGRQRFIGLYGSSYSTSRAWNFWNEYGWTELAQQVYNHDKRYIFIIFGAEWDLDLGARLCSMLDEAKIPYINTIGEPLNVVARILLYLTYFFSFPSGLGVLSSSLHVNTMFFYPKHLELMKNAWADPKMVESGAYKAMDFVTPGTAFSWAAKNNWI